MKKKRKDILFSILACERKFLRYFLNNFIFQNPLKLYYQFNFFSPKTENNSLFYYTTLSKQIIILKIKTLRVVWEVFLKIILKNNF